MPSPTEMRGLLQDELRLSPPVALEEPMHVRRRQAMASRQHTDTEALVVEGGHDIAV
jgi:hypothetical protein